MRNIHLIALRSYLIMLISEAGHLCGESSAIMGIYRLSDTILLPKGSCAYYHRVQSLYQESLYQD